MDPFMYMEVTIFEILTIAAVVGAPLSLLHIAISAHRIKKEITRFVDAYIETDRIEYHYCDEDGDEAAETWE